MTANFPLHGHSVNIVRQCRSALCDVLQSKFGCVATIDDVDSEGDLSIAQQQRPIEKQPRFSVKLRANVQVSVWKADLTSFTADAVVNAANKKLQHHGGLALALSKVGGPRIQRDSDEYIKKCGELNTGDAIITNAGSLPCKHIIHAVGPQLSPTSPMSDISRAEPLLEKAIRSILDKVSEHCLQSVAIPAISSGLFNYPLTQCANTIVSAVKDYYNNYNSHKHLPQEIFLVNHDEPSVREMDRACNQILAPSTIMKYSQAVASKGRNYAKTSTPTLQIRNVLLTLKRSQIEEQKTDVIVNSASYDRNLEIGVVSRAILKKAGPGIQNEIYGAYPNGRVIITKAHKLQCKNVYHTFCTEKGYYAKHQAIPEKILSDSVLECLWLAATEKHKSIAFPAIGTGALGFGAKEVAQIMLNAVADFAQKCPVMIEVYVVIYPSDEDTFQAFEEQLKTFKKKVSDPSFELAFESKDNFNGIKATSPRISLSGPSEEATREADRWLQKILFESADNVVICNNFIMHFGKQEHWELSNLIKKVAIKEFYEKGCGGIIINGDSNEDVAVAGLQVEALLRKTQMEFVRDKERDIYEMSMKNVSFDRKTIHASTQAFKDRSCLFENLNLWPSKVEKVENPTLKMLFDLKRKQLNCSNTETMFQCIPAQFCEMVSRIGFHAEYAPPEDPAFGEGIYFARKVKKAMEVWKGQNEEFVYFVEAEVLTGNSTPGRRGLILPPAVGTDPQKLYDSVSGGHDISVIFSGYQALPRYIITCRAR